MNHDELRPALRDAVNRHWRSSMDRSGPTPQLLDELAGIAEQYATAHAERVTARRELRAEAATPPLVAANREPPPIKHQSPGPLPQGGMFADPAQTPASLMEPSMQPGQSPLPEQPSSTHRTRTRTRGGAK
jgi:hypothetical protein